MSPAPFTFTFHGSELASIWDADESLVCTIHNRNANPNFARDVEAMVETANAGAAAPREVAQ